MRTSLGDTFRERKKRRGERSGQSTPNTSASTSTRPIYRIGGRVVRDGTATPAESCRPSTPPAVAANRTIRFPDDEPRVASLNERQAASEAGLADIALSEGVLNVSAGMARSRSSG